MFPALNWREIEKLAAFAHEELKGLYLDRVWVPERPEFPEGYLKSEWALRLTGKKEDKTLWVSLRPRNTYFYTTDGKGPKAATRGTRSAFDLNLSKQLKGLKVQSVHALEGDRAIQIEFAQGEESLGLSLVLIPAHPEGNLYRVEDQILIASSKLTEVGTETPYRAPSPSKNPPTDLQIRRECHSMAAFAEFVEGHLRKEAFETRKKEITAVLKERLKTARGRIAQSVQALREASQEPNWGHWGDLLKSVLHSPPEIDRAGNRKIQDFHAGEDIWVEVPCKADLSIRDQAEAYFKKSKKRQSRITETQTRLELAQSEEKELFQFEQRISQPVMDFEEVIQIEKQLGISLCTETPSKKKAAAAPGKSFWSQEGLEIRVGRSREENLALTLKYARGNDLWLHVKGRPSAHAVISLPPKKTASLETLIDAAHLVLHFSGGAEWGKTEVDYTFRKYVKRIPGTEQVTYTHNKTLLIQPDSARLKRLLGPR